LAKSLKFSNLAKLNQKLTKMLQYKYTTRISELSKSLVEKNKSDDFFINYLEVIKLSKLHRIFKDVKTKGYSVKLLIGILLSFPFIQKQSVNSYVNSILNSMQIGKDTFYRIKNNPKMNWRGFLYGAVNQALKVIAKQQGGEIGKGKEKEKSLTAFILDDTTLHKMGKYIEGVSKIWDHVKHKSVLGFQLLVMGYYNGTHFLPVDFSLHRSKGSNKKNKFGLKPKEYRKQYNKKRDKDTQGYKRKKELDIKKTDSAIKMLKRAVKRGIKASYVLTDSWFTNYEIVKTTISLGMHYIGMYSKVKTKFLFRGKQLTYKQIRNLSKKKAKRNRKFKLFYIREVVTWNDIKIVLYFTRQGKRGKWKVLISTDLSSTFNKTVEIYQIRWTIEVFFKDAKQMLGLGKGQGNDFDSQIADTTITMVQYIMLNVQNAAYKYESIGSIFRDTEQKYQNTRLHKRILAVIISIIQNIIYIFDEQDVDGIIAKLIYDEKVYQKLQLLIDNTVKHELQKVA